MSTKVKISNKLNGLEKITPQFCLKQLGKYYKDQKLFCSHTQCPNKTPNLIGVCVEIIDDNSSEKGNLYIIPLCDNFQGKVFNIKEIFTMPINRLFD